MPLRRRRRFHLERGFRRLAWALSMGILVIGVLAVAYTWLEERAAWDEATRPTLSRYLDVYVAQLGVVRFPLQYTDEQIKEALDRSSPAAIEKGLKRRSALRSLRAAHRGYAEQTDTQIANNLLTTDPGKWAALSDVKIDDNLEVTLLPTDPPSYLHREQGKHITHLYIPSASSRPSVLFTRVQVLKAEASGQREAGLILRDLGDYYDSPRPIPVPLSTSRPLAILVLILVWLPWGVFFFGRWIVRGFSSGKDEEDDLHRRPESVSRFGD
jgi:hypothetical protein